MSRTKYKRKESNVVELELYYSPDVWSHVNTCEAIPVECTMNPYGARWRLEKIVMPSSAFPEPSKMKTTLCEVLWEALDQRGYTVTPKGAKMLNLLVTKERTHGNF